MPSAVASASRTNAAEPRDKAYEAKTFTEAQTLLGVQSPEPGLRVRLTTPDIVDGSAVAGARVPVRVASQIPGTDWIAVFVDRGAKPLVTYRDFPPGDDHELTVSVPMTQTASVRAVVRAGGKFYQVSREVKVARVPPPAP